jgi:hypothetical protein
MQAFEERYLFSLLLLRYPRVRVIFVSGQPVHPSIIDYYLDMIPGIIKSHARRRLYLVSPDEATPRSLAGKLLDRPDLLEKIRTLIPDRARAHIVPYAPTWLDRELALQLGIPLYGSDPRFLWLGTKTSARRMFAEERVAHPFGRENLRGRTALLDAICDMRLERPDLQYLVVKLNEGAAGRNNACIDLASVPAPGLSAEREAVAGRIRDMGCKLPKMTYGEFFERMDTNGGIVEEFITGDEVLSPSVQMRITPLGDVEILSTHDQRLAGPNSQCFVGSRFPAHRGYAGLICGEAMKIGRRLAREGILGRFAVDFVVARSRQGWRSFAIEVNLRQGGTTHTFLMLKFLTGGTFDSGQGTFTADSGIPKYYVASDNLESVPFRAFTPNSFVDMTRRRDLRFDQGRQVGVLFHMISALPELGCVGLIAIADSRDDAEFRYRRAVEVVHEEAALAGERKDPAGHRPLETVGGSASI